MDASAGPFITLPPGRAPHETFRQFIDMVSGIADDIFRTKGYIRPLFHGIKRDGGEVIFPGMTDKDLMAALARAAFELYDVVRCAFVDEAWIVAALGPDKAANDAKIDEAVRVGARNHPDRAEVVMIAAEDAIEGQIMGRRPIIRPLIGKAYLGPLTLQPGGMLEGRFTGLLPRGRVQ